MAKDIYLKLNTTGLAPVRTQGMIMDPDEFEWEHDPHSGVCAECSEKYVKWKEKYLEQQKVK